jgi:hypothetical protein
MQNCLKPRKETSQEAGARVKSVRTGSFMSAKHQVLQMGCPSGFKCTWMRFSIPGATPDLKQGIRSFQARGHVCQHRLIAKDVLEWACSDPVPDPLTF